MAKTSVSATKVVTALAAVLTTFPATAAVITDEFTVNRTFVARDTNFFSFNDNFLLELFDPLLGTLQSVSLTFVTSLTDQSLSISATCPKDAPCDIAAERAIRTQDQFNWEVGGSVSPLLGPVDVSPDVSCSGVRTCEGAGPLPDVRNTYGLFFDDPADLTSFYGPGAFPLDYRLLLSCPGITFPGGGGESTCFYTGNVSMAAAVAYNYMEAIPEPEPPVAVPEPGTLTLVGLGLAAMGLTRRRNGRC